MGYLGKQPSAVPLTTADLIDGSVTSDDIADLDAAKLTGTVNNARISLDAAEIPNLDTAKVTTGTFADARISAGSVTQHVTATDLTPVKNDISLLALQNAINGNLSAYGLKNSWIEQFENSTYIENLTDVTRNATTEHIGSISSDHGITMAYQNNFSNSWTAATNTGSYTFANNGWTFSSYGKNGYGALIGDSPEWNIQGATITLPNTNTRSYCFWLKFTEDSSSNYSQYLCDMRSSVSNWRASTAGLKSTDYLNGVKQSGDVNLNALGAYSTFKHIIIVQGTSALTLGSRYAQESSSWMSPKAIVDSFEVYDGTISDADAATVAGYSGLLGASSSATGSFESTDVVPQDTTNKSSVGLVMLYKDQAGTNTLNTDIIAKVRANTGQAYQTLVLAGAGTYSDGMKIAIAPAIAVTAGQALSYQISFANQASGSKEARIHGIAMTY